MSAESPSEPPHRRRGTGLSSPAVVAVLVLLFCVVWILWGVLRSNVRPIWVSVRLYYPAAKPPPIPPPAAPAPLPLPAIPPPTPESPAELPEPPSVTPPRLELQSGKLPWELQIDALLSEQIPERDRSARLLRQLHSMPEEAFPRLAQEAADRLPDRDYTTVILPVLLSPETHGAAGSVLFADLLERPDSITLPALLSLVRMPQHPFAQSARESLALLVGDDFGSDWSRWESAIATVLAEQAEM